VIRLAGELEQLQVGADDAPPDAELLAIAVEELAAGRLPPESARDEVCHLALRGPRVIRELRRRQALRELERLRTRDPEASVRALAEIVGRRFNEKPETVRGWARGADSTQEPREAPNGKES